MEKSTGGHFVSVKPDKSLLSEIRNLFIDSKGKTDRRVYFYATEIFAVLDPDSKEEIFFIPVLPVASTDHNNPERVPTPIFMLDFSLQCRNEIMDFGKKIGLDIQPKHFKKPQVSISYAERLQINDGEPQFEFEDEIEISS